MSACTYVGCTRPSRARGLCRSHYEKLLRDDHPTDTIETAASRLRDAVLVCYNKHKSDGLLPTSCRFIFYELEAQGVIPKKYPDKPDGNGGFREAKRTPSQDVSVALTYWREKGIIPWADIKDETRSVSRWDLVPISVTESLHDILDPEKDPRVSWWRPSTPPIIICESRSLSGVLDTLAYEFQCAIAATNGQAGGFLHTDLIPMLTENQRVLYMGDLDFVGGHIETNTRQVLETSVGRLDWDRVALTEEQATAYHLTPIRKLDERDGKYHDAIETEALGQGTIVSLLRERLVALMPEDVRIERTRTACTERDALLAAVKGLI